MQLTQNQIALLNRFAVHFNNTDGNNIQEMMERKDISAFSNVPAAIIQSSLIAQLRMLESLQSEGLLTSKLAA